MQRILIGTIVCGLTLPLAASAQRDSTGKDTVHYNLQFVASKPARESYTVALRTLIDEGFRTVDASRDAGVIQTDWKAVRYIPPNANWLQRAAAKSLKLAVALDITILDLGSDSSRITIAGREQGSLTQDKPRGIKSAKRDSPFDELGWTTLRKIGEKIQAELAEGAK